MCEEYVGKRATESTRSVDDVLNESQRSAYWIPLAVAVVHADEPSTQLPQHLRLPRGLHKRSRYFRTVTARFWPSATLFAVLIERCTCSLDCCTLLKGSLALGKWPVLAEAALQSLVAQRRTLVGNRHYEYVFGNGSYPNSAIRNLPVGRRPISCRTTKRPLTCPFVN